MTQPAIPDANGVECHECGINLAGDYYEGDECPNDPEHATTPVYMTEEPLGRDDDADNYVGNLCAYVYDKG